MLDQSAIDALRKWRFAPGRDHGAVVRVLLEVPLRFTLREGISYLVIALVQFSILF